MKRKNTELGWALILFEVIAALFMSFPLMPIGNIKDASLDIYQWYIWVAVFAIFICTNIASQRIWRLKECIEDMNKEIENLKEEIKKLKKNR